MTEHTWNMIVVWSLVFNGLVQGITHVIVLIVMIRQGDGTGVGKSLRWREAALALKNVGTTAIHFLLAWVIWKGDFPIDQNQRFFVYAMAVFLILIAIIANLHLIGKLHQELMGRDSLMDRFSTRSQDADRQETRP